MSCRINLGSKANVSLQWFYADSRDNAGSEGVPLENSGSNLGFNYTVTLLTTSDNKFRVAMLELSKEFALGYYWCRVSGAMDSQFQNPSQVLRISTTCYSDVMCRSSALSTSQRDEGRCANGNYQEDVVIVDMQNTAGCVEAPTDASVETTEGDGKGDITGDDGVVVETGDDGKTEDSQGGKESVILL